jgi:hypothetical protein
MLIDLERNAMKLDFDMPNGVKFRFSTPPDFDFVENVLFKTRELKEHSHAEAEALLICSYAGRRSALGPMTTMENDGLSETWKAPFAGFFTYGEYRNAIIGKQEFHSITCCR